MVSFVIAVLDGALTVLTLKVINAIDTDCMGECMCVVFIGELLINNRHHASASAHSQMLFLSPEHLNYKP